MVIHDFSYYRIKCKGDYSYNTPSFDCDNNWHTEKYRWQKTMSGSCLLELLSLKLNDTHLIFVDFTNDYIYFDYFVPTTGACSHIYYYIKEIIK